MTALECVLDRLKNVHQEGDGYKASCPVPTHGLGRGDRNPSLSIATDAEGNILLRCFASCETEAVVDALGLSMADLFERRNGHRTRAGRGGSYTPSESRSTHQPATLENYAAYVGLPVGFLKGLGLGEARGAGYAWMVEGESDWQTLCFHGASSPAGLADPYAGPDDVLTPLCDFVPGVSSTVIRTRATGDVVLAPIHRMNIVVTTPPSSFVRAVAEV